MKQSLEEQCLRAWERGYEQGLAKGYKHGINGEAKPDIRARPLTGCTTIRGISWCGKPTIVGDEQRICNDCRRSFGIKTLEGVEEARESLACEEIEDYLIRDDGL